MPYPSLRPRAVVASLCAASLGIALCFARPAMADGGDAAIAETLFREGRKLSDGGDVAGACAKFRESGRLDPAVGTTFNIADCEERLGHLADAWSSFQEVTQLLPASDRRRIIAAQRAAAIEPRLPKLRIHLVAGAPAGTVVEHDGAELRVASLDVDLPENPGEHVIVVKALGHAPGRFTVALAEGQRVPVEVSPGPLQPESTSGSDTTHVSTSGTGGSRTLGYVLGGVGVAGIVTWAVAGALVLHDKSVVDDNCDAQKRCNDDGLAARDRGKTMSIVSTVGFITGVVGLGAGTYCILSAHPSTDGTASASATLAGRF